MSIPSEYVDLGAAIVRPVIYRPEDYVGLFRHLLIFAVDGVVIYLALVIIFVIFLALGGPNIGAFAILAAVVSFIFVWWYLAVLKPSRFRTVGYRVAGAKIVTLYGHQPTIWRMTMRLTLSVGWFTGLPPDLFTDLIFSTFGDDRQSLRDLMSETRLFRSRAEPVRTGRITYCLFTGLTRTISYARVR